MGVKNMTAFSNTRIVLLVLLVFNSLLVMVVLNNTAILMRISGTGDHDAHLLRHTELEYKTFINQIRQLPVIFVGGHFRSGTTLMRAILDVHPDISCGPEVNIIFSFTNYIANFEAIDHNRIALKAAGVDIQIVEEAASSFLYHVFKYREMPLVTEGVMQKERRGKRVCTKEPLILKHMLYLHKIFPNAKFVHMYRDGRAVSHSYMLHRKKKTPNFKNFLYYFDEWNKLVKQIDNDCHTIGKKFCLQVQYEELVMNTKPVLEKVVRFLNESWTDELLRHEQHLDEIGVSKREWSTGQIQKKIYNESLSPSVWLDQMPDYDPAKLDTRMLARFGYDLTIGVK